MSQAIPSSSGFPERSTRENVDSHNPGYQAYQFLHVAFTIAPILAGIDKFFHVLVNWDNYLAPVVNKALGGHGHTFMLVVGVIEIIAGLGVASRPKIFSYIVAVWLLGIIVNLLLIPASNSMPHYDVALRDVGLCLGGFGTRPTEFSL